MSSDYRQLAEEFAPILQIHAGNPMKPTPVEFMLDYATLYCKTTNFQSYDTRPFKYNKIKRYKKIGLREEWWQYFQRAKKEMVGDTDRWFKEGTGILDWYLSLYNKDFNPDWAKDEPKTWQDFWVEKMKDQEIKDKYPPTVYYQILDGSDTPIIQYSFFYPYDWWVNKHEGDWERLQVKVSSRNVNEAEIQAMVYYHHNSFTILTTDDEFPKSDYWHVYDKTHPLIWVGGSSKSCRNKKMDIKQYLKKKENPNSSGASCPWNFRHHPESTKHQQRESLEGWNSTNGEKSWKDFICEPFSGLFYPKTDGMLLSFQEEHDGPLVYQRVQLQWQKGNSIKVSAKPEKYKLIELEIGEKHSYPTEIKGSNPSWLDFPGRWGMYSTYKFPAEGPTYHRGWDIWPTD